jgi:polyisoprenoid-binding protein YceI
MRTAFRVFGAVGCLILALSGCAGTARQAPGPAPAAVSQAPARPVEGRRCEVISADSLLTIRVYRGGTLSRMGHNHLIASHDLAGTVFLPEDLTGASFELRVPVDKLTVDEPSLRQAEGEDFAAAVPDSAREGTRKNMLGEALLNAERFPEIVLKSERVEVVAPDELIVHALMTVKEHTSSVTIPVHHVTTTDHLTAAGEVTLKQTDLGLTPFSVMMGALQVQDEMKIRFNVRCLSARAMEETR